MFLGSPGRKYGGAGVRLKPMFSKGFTTYFDCYPQIYPQTIMPLIA